MEHVSAVYIGAGEMTEVKLGLLYIMLLDLPQRLKKGDQFQLSLTSDEQSSAKKVTVSVYGPGATGLK